MNGLVLGKFLPPHAGHVFLCEVASRMCDELTIVVASLAREPIAGELRVRWMRELFPRARVVHHTEELPQQPTEHPQFWELWQRSLLAICPRVDRLFASDRYGERLAAVLGARWVPVDPGRAAFPVSGTAVREDPWAHAAMLPRSVRAYYAKRVSIFGPESTGKSTLARDLASALGTVAVPEFARTYLAHAPDRPLSVEDFAVIGEGQAALEDTLAGDAQRFLVCDTDPLLTTVWSQTIVGEVPVRLREAAHARRYPLTLLCEVDLPWVEDPLRYLPIDRAGFFARCEAALRAADRRYVTIRGTGPARLEAALLAIEKGTP